jgi:5-methylcytosine-specific restriction endonuclease McrA
MKKRVFRWNNCYGKWRSLVLEKDKHMCKMCGSKDNLEVHHILPYKYFPHHKYNVKNGITLCVKCHDKIPVVTKKIKSKIRVASILGEL